MQKKLNSKNKIQLHLTSPWVKDNLVKVKKRNKEWTSNMISNVYNEAINCTKSLKKINI